MFDKFKEKMAAAGGEAMESHVATVQQLIKEQVGPKVKEIAKDDAKMTEVFKKIYPALPFPVRMAVKEDKFVEFCLAHRDKSFPPTPHNAPQRSRALAVDQDEGVRTLPDAVSFFARSNGLKLLRLLRESLHPLAELSRAAEPLPWLLAESLSPLRRSAQSAEEERLEAGKIENLRRACGRIDGALLARGQTFSFWKESGPPWKARGYVTGRELREGCVIPSTGGGLCQLSGSLFEAAEKAGLTLLERHRHTRHLPGLPYYPQRDATVFWNYVDLRFQSSAAVQIRAFLTSEDLVVQIRGQQKPQPEIRPRLPKLHGDPLMPAASDCLTCGKAACGLRHKISVRATPAAQAIALLDGCSSEFSAYLAAELTAHDAAFLPWNGRSWNTPVPAVKTTFFVGAALRRALLRRLDPKRSVAPYASLKGAEILAVAYARALPANRATLFVDQYLLPFLWRHGVLKERPFIVLARRLSLSDSARRLDDAVRRYPAAASLREFRAPEEWVAMEQAALEKAARIVTPHAEVAQRLPRARKILWHEPLRRPPPDATVSRDIFQTTLKLREFKQLPTPEQDRSMALALKARGLSKADPKTVDRAALALESPLFSDLLAPTDSADCP